MGLLPTSPDATIERDGEPTLLCIDDDRTEEVFGALQSETARTVFRELNRAPGTATDLADELDTSVQNVDYHLGNLREAGLVAVRDTVYSEKGREMNVYGPAEEPLLVFLGASDDRPALRRAFEDFAAVLGPGAVLVVLKGALGRLLDVGDWV